EPEAVQGCIATAGLSLGEYTALVFAGALSFRDGLQVVRRRGEAMQAASDARPGAMVSVVGLEAARVDELCRRAQGGGVGQGGNPALPGHPRGSGRDGRL